MNDYPDIAYPRRRFRNQALLLFALAVACVLAAIFLPKIFPGLFQVEIESIVLKIDDEKNGFILQADADEDRVVFYAISTMLSRWLHENPDKEITELVPLEWGKMPDGPLEVPVFTKIRVRYKARQ